jgi:hypothetical protein
MRASTAGAGKTEIGGFLDTLAATAHEAVPLFVGWAITEGPIEAAEFARMRAWIAAQVNAAGQVDALLVALQGRIYLSATAPFSRSLSSESGAPGPRLSRPKPSTQRTRSVPHKG